MTTDLSSIARWSVFARPLHSVEPVESKLAGEQFEHIRVIQTHREVDTHEVTLVATVNLTTLERVIDVHTAAEFAVALRERKLLPCNYNPLRPKIRTLEDIAPEYRAARGEAMKKRLNFVQYIDQHEACAFDSSLLSKAIAEVCTGKVDGSTHGETWIRDLLWDWWRYGGNAMVFVPHYFGAGAKSRAEIMADATRKGSQARFTRIFRKHEEQRKKDNKEGCEITPDIYDLIVKTMKEVLDDEDKRYGLNKDVRRRKGLPWALFRKEIHKAMQKFFATVVVEVDGKPQRAELKSTDLPNRYQIRHIGRTIFNVPEVLRKIKGSKSFILEHRGLNGSNIATATRRGQVYEIDCFELDLHCVNDVTLLPVGRLFAYFVVDVYSKAIVGVYVTCGDPDYRNAVMALRCAFMPKSVWGQLIGLKILDDEWPMHGISESLLADNAEFATYASDILPEYGTTDVANTPPCRGDLKAQVEQTGELADIGLLRFLPGATKGPQERCTEAPVKRAKLSVTKLTHLLTEWAYKVHNVRDLTASRVNPDLIGKNVQLTPNGLWKHSVKIRGLLPAYDDNTYLPRMLPRTRAKVTRWGLVVGDVVFDRPDDPVFRRLKEGATTFGCDRYLAVHFDRAITSRVYLVPEDPSNPVVVVPRSSKSDQWAGYTFKEVSDAYDEAERRGQLNKNEHHRCEINNSLKVDQTINEATKNIIESYGSMANRNRVAAGVGKDIPRKEQSVQQLASEDKTMPAPSDATPDPTPSPPLGGKTSQCTPLPSPPSPSHPVASPAPDAGLAGKPSETTPPPPSPPPRPVRPQYF